MIDFVSVFTGVNLLLRTLRVAAKKNAPATKSLCNVNIPVLNIGGQSMAFIVSVHTGILARAR